MVNKKDCIEYYSCEEQMKVAKANGTVTPMTRDSNNELVIDLHCEACHHYKYGE